MSDQADVKSVYKALCDSYNAGGRAELANFYASDAIYMSPGEDKVTGREGEKLYRYYWVRVTPIPAIPGQHGGADNDLKAGPRKQPGPSTGSRLLSQNSFLSINFLSSSPGSTRGWNLVSGATRTQTTGSIP